MLMNLELSLCNNEISDIQALPTSLTSLDLKNNQVTSLKDLFSGIL